MAKGKPYETLAENTDSMQMHSEGIQDLCGCLPNYAKEVKEVKVSKKEREESEAANNLSFSSNQEHGQGDNMAIRERIEAICDDQLGVAAERAGDPVWNKMNKLVSKHNGVHIVATMFEGWADGLSNPPVKPVSAFLRYLDGLPVEEARNLGRGDAETGLGEAKTLSMDLTYLSGGSVAFTDKQRVRLAAVLKEGYTPDEVKSVFRTFVDTLTDDFAVSMAPKNFVEKVESLCYAQRRKKQDAEKQASTLDVLHEQERLRAQAEVSAQLLKDQEEQMMSEEEL